jgi:hypothetical protein
MQPDLAFLDDQFRRTRVVPEQVGQFMRRATPGHVATVDLILADTSCTDFARLSIATVGVPLRNHHA